VWKKDDETFLKLVASASKDPDRESKRLRIISQIDRGIDLEILEMDDFSLGKGLGSGAFSDVCLLTRKTDQRKFAGKFLKTEICASDFVSEASIMKACSSDCTSIVNLVAITTTPQCLVLDYYVNGSLDIAFLEDKMKMENGEETEFPFLRRLGYILDLCQAVDVLHRKNICHRDIALRNFLLSNDKEHIVLSDFSLSRILNSATERQSTLTAIVPESSAPETFKNNATSIPESKSWKRFYSLKSDVWSLGIVMFEIIDMESLNVDKTQCLPSGFPRKRLPSKKIFNRIEELWIQIIRCLDEKPERRPQSWEVHEKIEMLIQNPLNIGNENEGYKTNFSVKASPNLGYHYKDAIYWSGNPFSSMSNDRALMSTVSVDEKITSDSSILDSLLNSLSAQPEIPDGTNYIMEELVDTFGKEHKLMTQLNGGESSSLKKQRFTNVSVSENGSNGHRLLAAGTRSRNANMLSPKIKLIKRSCSNCSQRKMYDQSKSTCQWAPYIRFTDLCSSSNLGSCLSLYSQNLTSSEEVLVISDGIQNFPPLSESITSSAKKIKFSHNLTLQREAENSLVADSEAWEQSPSSYQRRTIDCETPRFFVIV